VALAEVEGLTVTQTALSRAVPDLRLNQVRPRARVVVQKLRQIFNIPRISTQKVRSDTGVEKSGKQTRICLKVAPI
jgi:arginine repressor